MTVRMVNDYYMKNKARLTTQFDKTIFISKDILQERFSEMELEEIFMQMRNQFEGLIPEIPYIGGRKNSFTSMLIEGFTMISFFRILEKKGMTYREIGDFSYKFSEKINKRRVEKLEKAGQNPKDQIFNATYLNYCKNLAKTTQLRKYPEDFVMEYVEGDGKTFDYGLNFTECAVYKSLKKLGAERYVPFLCLADFAQANVYGFGFTRTQTIGNGDPLCDHRFLKKGTTPRAWPPETLKELKMK